MGHVGVYIKIRDKKVSHTPRQWGRDKKMAGEMVIVRVSEKMQRTQLLLGSIRGFASGGN